MNGLTMKDTIGDELLADDRVGACPECLWRSNLITVLSPFIEHSVERNVGWSVRQLLALDNDRLIEKVASGDTAKVNGTVRQFTLEDLETSLAEHDCWCICQHDDLYPEQLAGIGADAPPVLYGSGDRHRLRWLTQLGSVAIVGARRSSSYGLEVARNLAAAVAKENMIVVGGLRLGVEGAAHRGALETGRTVAILPRGLDKAYPKGHARMFNIIKEQGLVLSEFPPETEQRRWCFEAKNRLIAGLCGATVVVEATNRSGALSLAAMAADMNRGVGAVPGPITSGYSTGSNDLIKNGAPLTTDAKDVLELL